MINSNGEKRCRGNDETCFTIFAASDPRIKDDPCSCVFRRYEGIDPAMPGLL